MPDLARAALRAAALAVLTACVTPVATDRPGGGTGPGDACTEGAVRCDGADLVACTDGREVVEETCPEACDPSLGCVSCVPGTGSCSDDGSASTYCLPDGSGTTTEACDPLLGLSCDDATGLCAGPCADQNLSAGYIGCEYFPTITGNAVANEMHFAVAIANTTRADATVTIDGGALAAPVTVTVPGGSVAVQTLPWVEALKLCNPSGIACNGPPIFGGLVPGGAYHLRSTRPVTVYQFNPLEYHVDGVFSYTNDASLLLPVNAWTGKYLTAAFWRTDYGGSTGPSLLAVTAAHDGTSVTITTTADTRAEGQLPAFTAGVPQTIVLDAGDVVQLGAAGREGTQPKEDLTGSWVVADGPVQVISGAYCAFVPNDAVFACDHLEESMFPVASLSTAYLVTSPAMPRLPTGKVQVVRIVATAPDTTLTYDPPQPGAPTTIAEAGQFVSLINNAGDFLVSADHRVLVAQYMEGQQAGGKAGDPAMTLAVPVDQYRATYLFHAPTNYQGNYVNVTAPTGTTVTLDGAVVTGFTPIGGSGYDVAKVLLGAGQDGNHEITADDRFGISVYGYGQYTSYGYPGGLDLKLLARP